MKTYTYDIEGNVQSMVMEDRNDSALSQMYKRADYFYDLVSGKVNQLDYQRNQPDFFMQAYEYDADNRITDVQTSSDSINWTEEANYQYYSHGPLAREVIGRRQVQGVDYAYTINGWIKGINSSLGANMQNGSTYDMGHDGDVHGDNPTIGRDAYGFTLNYFNGDYRPIGGKTFEATALQDTGLYNGNIAGATYTIQHLLPKTMGWIYHYDQLNRYIRQKGYVGPDTVDNNWSTGTPTLNMAERTSYDENGNILTYVRHGNTTVGPLAMDSLNYHYYKHTNQLAQVNDAVPAGNYLNDIDNETSKYNYKYNAIGQLAKDSAGGLDTIKWTVYGKVKKIIKTNGDSIVFEYDPLGNRLEKRNFTHHDSVTDTTLYARDAQGNILAIYNRKQDSIKLSEFDIYGSKRIGVIDTNLLTGAQSISCSCSPISNPFDSSRIGYLEGQRRYELTNHLGNVLSILDDRKLPIDTSGTPNVADYYNANTISAQDYYPFGMVEPGRSYSLAGDSSYRFGMNGMMKDNDIYGQNNTYTAMNWEYDPRIVHRWNIDPETKTMPNQSPYATFNGNPILYSDPTGASGIATIDNKTKTITVEEHLVFYGSKAETKLSNEIATGIAAQWNGAHGKADVGGVQYKVKFKITYETVTTSQAEEKAKSNGGNYKNNFIAVEPGASSSQSSANSALWHTGDDLGGSTTPAHENGHLLGYGNFPPDNEVDKNGHTMSGQDAKETPDIMTARGTPVDKKWSLKGGGINPNVRRVNQSNINYVISHAKFDKNGHANIGSIDNATYDSKSGNFTPHSTEQNKQPSK